MSPRLAALLLALAVGLARAQEAAPPVTPLPDAIDGNVVEAPTTILSDEAAELIERLHLPDAASMPPAPSPAATAPASGSRTRVVTLEPPPMQNPTSSFVFGDATDRSLPRSRTLAERKATVEAFRQSLRRPGAGR